VWRYSVHTELTGPPFVVFVCQTKEQREQFIAAADRELTGHHWHPSAGPEHHDYVGRHRVLFALEHDAHAVLAGAATLILGPTLEAWQPPKRPPGHPAQDGTVRRVRLQT
jgi:hypothetical protein